MYNLPLFSSLGPIMHETAPASPKRTLVHKSRFTNTHCQKNTRAQNDRSFLASFQFISTRVKRSTSLGHQLGGCVVMGQKRQ